MGAGTLSGWGVGKLMRRRKEKGQGGDLGKAAPLVKADALGSFDSSPYPLGTPFLGIPSLPSLPLPIGRGEILGMGAASAILLSSGPQRGLGEAGPSNRGRQSMRVPPPTCGGQSKSGCGEDPSVPRVCVYVCVCVCVCVWKALWQETPNCCQWLPL